MLIKHALAAIIFYTFPSGMVYTYRQPVTAATASAEIESSKVTARALYCTATFSSGPHYALPDL